MHMPTTKARINLTVPSDVERELQRIAKRDARSVSTVALELLRQALEIEEDMALLRFVERREKQTAKYVSHAQAWK